MYRFRHYSWGSSFIFTTETYLSAMNPECFSRERMGLLRDAWDEFGSPFHEGLFERWKQKGELAIRSDLQVSITCNGRFLRYVLPFKYDYFGSIDAPSRSFQLAGAR